MNITEINRIYKPKIRALLRSAVATLSKAGLDPHPAVDDFTDEEYAYNIADSHKPVRYSVTITITEQVVHDGVDEEAGETNGVNFFLEIIGDGGEIFWSFAINNFQPDCYVSINEPDDIAERWVQFTNCVTPDEIRDCIQDRLKRLAAAAKPKK